MPELRLFAESLQRAEVSGLACESPQFVRCITAIAQVAVTSLLRWNKWNKWNKLRCITVCSAAGAGNLLRSDNARPTRALM
jgi:hypothetical protein